MLKEAKKHTWSPYRHAWFSLYLTGFPETLQELRQCLENLSREFIEAFREGKKEKIERAHPSLAASVPRKSLKRCWSSTLQTTEVLGLYIVMRHHMWTIMEMCMIPQYLAKIASLEAWDPWIHQEFMNGNWVINKCVVVQLKMTTPWST